MDDDCDLTPCVAHCWDTVDSDGRQRCSECGATMPRHEDPDDCLGCGVCEWCVERSMDAWDEGGG